MTIKTVAQILDSVQGVWEGTYAHHKPDGTLIDKYASRQETRLIGEDWYERIIYKYSDGREEILDFRAKVIGNQVIFDDPKFIGWTTVVDDNTLVFPYYWKDNPSKTILEIIHTPYENYRTRVWQTFENGAMSKLTLIEEHRILQGEPKFSITEWF